MAFDYNLCKWIFCLVKHSLRLIEAYLLYSEVTEYIEKCLTIVSECYCTVMRISAFDKNVTVESAHFLYSKNTDTAE